MDIVYIRDLRIETIIGIYDWEREVKQTVSLDLDMAHDIRQATVKQMREIAPLPMPRAILLDRDPAP